MARFLTTLGGFLSLTLPNWKLEFKRKCPPQSAAQVPPAGFGSPLPFPGAPSTVGWQLLWGAVGLLRCTDRSNKTPSAAAGASVQEDSCPEPCELNKDPESLIYSPPRLKSSLSLNCTASS